MTSSRPGPSLSGPSLSGPSREPPRAEVSTCVFILGMHRSGTSMLAGALEAGGLYLGRVLRHKNPALNPSGLREPDVVLRMHEDLLEHNGGSWDNPPPGALDWPRLHIAVRNLFIESRAGAALWGFKDPRTLLAFEGWADVLTDWRAAGIFRHPGEVAASLQSRNGMSRDAAIALWTAYNQRLLELQTAHGFALMEFSGDAGRTGAGISRVAADLGLDAEAALAAHVPSMRKFEAGAQDVPVPPEAQALYEALRARVPRDVPGPVPGHVP